MEVQDYPINKGNLVSKGYVYENHTKVECDFCGKKYSYMYLFSDLEQCYYIKDGKVITSPSRMICKKCFKLSGIKE